MTIIFIDIDNTLLDFDLCCRETISRGFDQYGLGEYDAEREVIFHRVNNGLWQALERGELTFEELKKIRFARVFEAMGITADGPAFEESFRDILYDVCIPVEGAHALLAALKEKGCVICAASNGPLEQQRHRLELAGMLPYFDQLFISEDIGASKPSHAFFEEAFVRLRAAYGAEIKPQDCWMIGDSLTSDILGGLNAGMHTLWYQREGVKERDDIVPEKTVKSLGEIENLISQPAADSFP